MPVTFMLPALIACQSISIAPIPSDGSQQRTHQSLENAMANEKGPNIKKKQKCKNCEGKGLLKKGDKVVTCQRCKGTGVR